MISIFFWKALSAYPGIDPKANFLFKRLVRGSVKMSFVPDSSSTLEEKKIENKTLAWGAGSRSYLLFAYDLCVLCSAGMSPPPVESNPDVLTNLAHQMGAPESW